MNQSSQKLMTIVLSIFLFSGVSVFSKTTSKKSKEEYWAIRNVKLSSLGSIQRAVQHKKMTRILIKLDALEKKPGFHGGSKFSYQKLLNDLTETVVPFTHATEGANQCLFGGWVSVRSGRCNTPFSSSGVAAATAAGTSQYDSKAYCNDRNLFRCNPLVFGPGLDQSLVDEQYSNINGNANNGEPYSAGICVDISSGYDGLSRKCQELSDHLDSLRSVPWRESDFFNEERAEEFRALQAVIADRCEENRENINADGMCTSLENSLSLTATAARAGELNGINLEQIMPHCNPINPIVPAVETCEKPRRQTLNNLNAALEEIKDQEECQFGRVQASDRQTSMNRSFSFNQCPVSIQGTLLEGIGSDNERVVIQLSNSDSAFAGRIGIEININDSKEDIVAKIRASSEFSGACSDAAAVTCNQPSGRVTASLLSELNAIRSAGLEVDGTQVTCDIEGVDLGVAHETDTEVITLDGAARRSRTAACPVYFSGEVQELLESDQFNAGETGVGTTLTFSKGGSSITIPHTVRGSGDKSLATTLSENSEFLSFCRSSASQTEEEAIASDAMAVISEVQMRDTFGLSQNQFLTDTQTAALMSVRDIPGLSVEVDEFGKLTLSHENLAEHEERLTQAFGNLHIGEESQSVSVYPNPEERVDFLASRASITLTSQERAIVTPMVGSGADNSVTVISGITRDAEGNMVILTNSTTTSQGALRDSQIASFERMTDGLVVDPDQEASDPSVIRSYTIRAPSSEEFGGLPASIPSFVSSDIRTGIQTMRGRDLTEAQFNIVASRPVTDSEGSVSISYSLEGDEATRISSVNLFISNLRNSLRSSSSCSMSPTAGGAIVNAGGNFTISCNP